MSSSENSCILHLDSTKYYVGQTVTGTVECNFSSETKVRAVRVRFKGRAKVQWEETHNSSYKADETYYEAEYDLLKGETTFPPGKYMYTFSFKLPNDVPPSFVGTDGNIKHTIIAIVDRPWAIDYTSKEVLPVYSVIDLNTTNKAKIPVDIAEKKKPFSLFGKSSLITLRVRLPAAGYVPTQKVAFTATINNESKINVEKVQFKLVQGFTFHTYFKNKTVKEVRGEVLTVSESFVEAGKEKSWNLELQIPLDTFNGNFEFCKIIKSFIALKGEVFLPTPYTNFKIVVPLILGSVPLQLSIK